MDNLDLKSLGLGQLKDTKNFLDLDLEELSNEVDGLESLAKQMESLTFTDMIDDGLILEKKRKRNFRPKKGGKRRKKQASKFSQMIQSGSSSSVTLCQLMNICDSVPMTSNVVEEKNMMMPFASSLRSELIVDAPDSLTSDTEVHEALVLAETGNTTRTESQELEKAARMEDISFTEGQPAHREIDFSQGIPVTSHMVVTETRPGESLETR